MLSDWETMSEETPLLVSADEKPGGFDRTVAFGDVKLHKTARYPSRQQSKHARYQSSVTHLPKRIIGSPRAHHTVLSEVQDHTDRFLDPVMPSVAFDEEDIPATKLDQTTRKQSHYIPFLQVCLMSFNMALFTVTILFVIVGVILESKSFSSPVVTGFVVLLFLCSISGLFLTISYKNVISHGLSLNKKIFDAITQAKVQQINNVDLDVEPSQVSLLESFRRGDFPKQLALCSNEDLKQLLPVVAMTLCQLPFGLTEFRSNLFVILANRISTDASLDQAWRFFLNCNRDIPEITRTWENHEYLKPEQDSNEYKGKVPDESTADSVSFFRSLFKDLKKTGARKSIDADAFVCDPINGNILTQVQLNKIMPSNARPYLVDCYTVDSNTGQPLLSSKMLLKKGDDLRKDLGVMLMFRLMNELWRENEIHCNGHVCETLVYNVIPMALDFGAMEFIEGANKIANIDEVMKYNKTHNSAEYDVIINRLIATAAASYVASYVCGVRDRHHDNILICSDGTLFHIDFSHILGEKLKSLDAAKIAIPTKFVKVLGNENWNKFLGIVVSCFEALRNNYLHLADYARIVFGFMKRTDENEKFLKESLLIDVEEKEALKKIKTLFSKAPSQIKTKMKNVIHSLAVKGKQKSSEI
eukprot:1031344_1